MVSVCLRHSVFFLSLNSMKITSVQPLIQNCACSDETANDTLSSENTKFAFKVLLSVLNQKLFR